MIKVNIFFSFKVYHNWKIYFIDNPQGEKINKQYDSKLESMKSSKKKGLLNNFMTYFKK